MRTFEKISLLLLTAFGAFLLVAEEFSKESMDFLAARPAGVQEETAQAVRDALNGNVEALKKVRAGMLQDAAPPAGVRVENTRVGDRRIRFYYPGSEPGKAVVLYLHGGGWTLGGLEGSARFCGDLAKDSGLDVATLDYRLAPEHRAPAALEDVLAAVRLLRERGYRRIYLAGDSAGGNLAASAAGKERSAIAGVILYYPVVLAKNDRSESWRKYGVGFGLDGALMEAFNESYAPGALAEDPAVSPLLAEEFVHYPETLIVAAECDVLHDQGRAFAELLKKNGVPVTHRTLPGTIHAFMTYPGMENAYQEGVRLATEFLAGKETQMKNLIAPESIVRISRIEVDPAQLPEYLALVTECGRESMAKEPGVYMMYSMQEKAHPERITILEIYADRAAYEHHIQTPHFQKYKQKTLKMVKQLDLLDQNPLVPEMRMK
ncbi:alpha/beta hydrolase fold domain-containing protein [uncultured Victivallis sp.]|uniref:alpha/beta hydrolase fold domain-containing protein n=1 Tax=uncultured Victivallis sp. TaxID=354118 RepID=UPI0025CC970A|nr:alpha/beta hydrolase fold domain-containing protein [uncultured Victivallis sp.]